MVRSLVTRAARRPADPEATVGPTLAGLLLGALLVPGVLGVTAVVVALPSLARDLALPSAAMSWVLVGYALTQAVFVAVFGRVGDVWGLRTVLLAGAVLIAAGSVLSVLGEPFVVLVVGRLLQGAGAGSLQMVAFGTASARYAGVDRAKVLGVVGAVVGVISGSATLIGGLLTDALTWRAVVALPALSLLAMAATLRIVPTAHSGGTRLDISGAGLVALLAAAILLLLEAPSLALPGWVVWVLAMVTLLAAPALWHHVRTVPDGFIPRTVARSRRYVLTALAALMVGAGYLAMLFAAPLLLAGRGWSATLIGLVLLPAGVLGAASSRATGSLIATHDPFRVTAAIAAASAAGLLVAGLLVDGAAYTAVWVVVLALAAAISGFYVAQVALLDRVPAMVNPDVRTVATGLVILMFLLGGALGPALVAGLIGPLGMPTAVAPVAALPAAGALLALAAGAASDSSSP